MGCLRSTITVVVMLVSLISLEDFLSLAHRDLNKNNIVILKSDEGLVQAKRWYRGRRMVIEDEKSSMKQSTGDAKNTLTKLLQSSNTEESSTSTTKPHLRSERNKASEIQGKAKAIKDSSNDTRDNIEKLKLLEASDQLFKMLNRDYDLRPRRHPPVHN
ncbi:uncharacterized protein LOC122015144 isoform X2 [Zingiber officinale]|nr:uncharacterized protein LOC122008844 isoform X2 [Zingiber officinale]XP_042427817.1 uncharacterized protein LOC122015144 isoform X2 [Zingiber officinale]